MSRGPQIWFMGRRMRWADGFIAVDWGTTNRRAYLVGGDGRRTDEFEDGKGVLSVPSGGFPEAVAEIRERLEGRPLLLAGMIGSNRGWLEAPYIRCPAGLDELAHALVWPEADAAIVPGVSLFGGGRADVMRGEEVQLLGALAAGEIPPDCLVCHPGTHNKWVEMKGGRIAAFRTVMTGELFNLLKEHSILSDLLQQPAEAGDAFARGVDAALGGAEPEAELFSVRARVLLGAAQREDASSWTSGFLIGRDVRIGLASAEGPVVVMGRPELTRLYATAIAQAGREAVELDGEQSFLSGIIQIARRLQ